MTWRDQKVRRIRTHPYKFLAEKGKERFWSKNFTTRDEAKSHILRLKKNGYRITMFVNEYTGRKLKIPGGDEK